MQGKSFDWFLYDGEYYSLIFVRLSTSIPVNIYLFNNGNARKGVKYVKS